MKDDYRIELSLGISNRYFSFLSLLSLPCFSFSSFSEPNIYMIRNGDRDVRSLLTSSSGVSREGRVV